MELEKQKLELLTEEDNKELVSFFKRLFHKRNGRKKTFEREDWPVRGLRSGEGLSSGSGQVVLTSIPISLTS